jgi:hypothetical protein
MRPTRPRSLASGTRPAAATESRNRDMDEEIREHAYRIYLSRVREGVPGDPVTDWLRAEQELRRVR